MKYLFNFVKMSKEKQTKLPEFYFSFQVLWLRISGIEVLKENESFFYKTYSISCLLFMATFIMVECMELKFHSDFDTISLICWYIIMDSLTLAKAVVIFINRKEIGNLMKSFHEGFYKPDRARGGKFEEQCIDSILRKTNSQMTPYGIFVFSAWGAGITGSLISRLTELPENWTLPYLPISLVDITRSPTFEIAYVYQVLAGTFVGLWIYLCDYSVIGIMAQVVAQLKILERCIRNYKSRSMKKQDEEKQKADSNTLRETIEHHINLLETVDEVESLCSYLVLFVFIANLIMLCLTMYNASLLSMRSIEFIMHLAYSALVAAQTLLYCWWGNEITLSNEALALGIFETYHPDDLVSQSKALKLMLVKAQKPLIFTAGKFVALSLETYKAIMKGSFSYFAVLRQVNTK